MYYPIVVNDENNHIMCDCTNGCKRCGREFGGTALPDEVNHRMRDLHESLLDMKYLADNNANFEHIRLMVTSALSHYDAASKRLRNPPKYKLVRIEDEAK